MCSAEPLNCSLAALGRDRVMFAADYPFESAPEAGEFMDHVPLTEPVREDIAFKNAAKYLEL
jgi:2,3-dihydroxybenzoate decarboxylase